MKEKLNIGPTVFSDLILMECGRERCVPEKNVVNKSKDYHLFHYVTYGKGNFQCDNKAYKVCKGMLFYIPPNVQARYSPDKEDPWTYQWLGFEGSAADYFLKLSGLSLHTPIIKDDKYKTILKPFDELVNEYLINGEFDINMLGIAYQMFGALLKNQKNTDQTYSLVETHIIMAKNFIDNNFQFDIKIDDVAGNIGVTPNYLANIFKKHDHSSPKQYLIKVRMENARRLLLTRSYMVKEVATLVGYKNQLHFSSEFKKFYGKSPLKYLQGVFHDEIN